MEQLPGLKPWECDEFTLAEIQFVLAGPAPAMGGDEIAANVAARQAMTPKQRLEWAKRFRDG